VRIARALLASRLRHRKTPLCVSLEIASRCNLTCSYCEQCTGVPEMTTEQIFRMIDEFRAEGMIRLGITGGEPTLRDDLGRIVDYSVSKGVLTSVFSNGYRTPERARELRNLDVYLTTIDGTKPYHDRQRGEGAFEKAVAGIEAMKRMRVPVMTYTVLTRWNLNQIDPILDLAREMGFLAMFVLVFKHWRSYSRVEEELFPTMEEQQRVFSRLVELKRRSAPIGNSMNYLEYMARGRKHIPVCRSGQLFCSVDPQGNVAPCGPRLGDDQLYNGVKLGFMEAFRRAPRPACPRNYCVTGLETSFLFSFNPRAIWNVLRPR
jgi:MoaA/NifB/PqqE/SkfB family radical SAM enzyme